MAEHNILGVEAERKALTFLSEKGYQLLQKNYRFQKAEVDLIMQQGTTLICVEVKARTNDFFGTPEQFVSSKKIKLLVRAMDHYLKENTIEMEVRFDVVACIVKGNKWFLKYITNALYSFE